MTEMVEIARISVLPSGQDIGMIANRIGGLEADQRQNNRTVMSDKEKEKGKEKFSISFS